MPKSGSPAGIDCDRQASRSTIKNLLKKIRQRAPKFWSGLEILPCAAWDARSLRLRRENRRPVRTHKTVGIFWILACYLMAPAVRPRTSWRETIMLKMITGRATMVPVAIIWPQGSS